MIAYQNQSYNKSYFYTSWTLKRVLNTGDSGKTKNITKDDY